MSDWKSKFTTLSLSKLCHWELQWFKWNEKHLEESKDELQVKLARADKLTQADIASSDHWWLDGSCKKKKKRAGTIRFPISFKILEADGLKKMVRSFLSVTFIPLPPVLPCNIS